MEDIHIPIEFVNKLNPKSYNDIIKFIEYDYFRLHCDENLVNEIGNIDDIWLFLLGINKIELFELAINKLKELPIKKSQILNKL